MVGARITLSEYLIPLGNPSPLRGSLIVLLYGGWEMAPRAISQPPYKSCCEALQALRGRGRAFPRGIEPPKSEIKGFPERTKSDEARGSYPEDTRSQIRTWPHLRSYCSRDWSK